MSEPLRVLRDDKAFEMMYKIDEFYHTHMHCQSPFLRFIMIGNQTTGKSTLVERFLHFPMNIVKEGTGTRCPLYVTCIHDKSQDHPKCRLSDCSECPSEELPHQRVLGAVVDHMQSHVKGFTQKPLRLTVRSANVPNMIFVDLPGIMSVRQEDTEDKRLKIQNILKEEMAYPQTALVVLLETKDFATNDIVEFVDQALHETHGQRKWLERALFVMNKFDLKMADYKVGTAVNEFLEQFWSNRFRPYLVYTPKSTWPDNAGASEQYSCREGTLRLADEDEHEKFTEWTNQIKNVPGFQNFDDKFKPYVGFPNLVKKMEERLLENARQNLPEVITHLRREAGVVEEELQAARFAVQMLEAKTFSKFSVQFLKEVRDRVLGYLDGAINVLKKFPEAGQTLQQDLEMEENLSAWTHYKLLPRSHEEEGQFRAAVSKFVPPAYCQPNMELFGGKQYQRAVHAFMFWLRQLLPTPEDIPEELIINATGALAGKHTVENWENAAVKVIQDYCDSRFIPGVSCLCKLLAAIFHNLLVVAMKELNDGVGKEVAYLYPLIGSWVCKKYDELVWNITKKAAQRCFEPLKSSRATIITTLPTLFAPAKEAEEAPPSPISFGLSASPPPTIEFLRSRRSLMTTEDEAIEIADRCVDYLKALCQFETMLVEMVLHDVFYNEFKTELQETFGPELLTHEELGNLLPEDGGEAQENLTRLEAKQRELQKVLDEASRMEWMLPKPAKSPVASGQHAQRHVVQEKSVSSQNAGRV